MKRLPIGAALFAGASILLFAAASVYPVGTTIYVPSLAWSGFTVLSPLGTQAVIVIDMNGNIVKQWDGFVNSAGGPARILPGGVVMGANGTNPPRQESLELIERDFDGQLLWHFDHNEEIQTRDGQKIWSARQHHDWQRPDFPAGYYSPESHPSIQGSNTLILTHTNHARPNVAGDASLEDDHLIEVSWDGKILWEWTVSDHIDDFHFSKEARAAIAKGIPAGPAANAGNRSFDWFHMNSATYVGPNRWFEAGDKRFAPENVIISSREASLLAIVARDGSVVWQLGPDFSATPELRTIKQIIGQHNAHLIPKGLPGAGDLMVFDNGGASGYGNPTPVALDGRGIFARATSRVLEIDPVALKLVWSYSSPAFYAGNISGAQRLPNGNTLVTEGPDGRIFEVTKDDQIVWEYVFPMFNGGRNSVYRAYRVPYSWIPQIAKPNEKAITPPAPGAFRLPQ
jgi:Arylsulfotransferase (ASST)